MPTRKQRRREAKAKRHEYEYVLVDESGEETPIDPAELRAQKEAKEKDGARSAKGSAATTKGKQPVARDRRGRVVREPRKPSWRRAATMGLLFVVVLLAVTSLVGKHKPTVATRVLLAVLYGGAGIPFFYWMDRLAYRRWERAVGRAPQPTPKKKT